MAYACDDGTTVVAHLRPAGSVFLFLPDETVELPRVPSASGTKFSDDSTIYWSKGAEATIIRPEGASVVCQEQRGRSIIEDAKLRGVDYWATGNEPGWTLEIAADSIRFVTGYGTEHYRFATPEPLVDEDGHGVEYAASANDHRLTVTIKYLRCGDSMSGTQFEGMVRLVFDDHELPGCGQALH